MEIWKTLRVSQISTPPTTTTEYSLKGATLTFHLVQKIGQVTTMREVPLFPWQLQLFFAIAAVVGPFIGIFIGHWLGRSWQPRFADRLTFTRFIWWKRRDDDYTS
jgi:hypothetical protein